MITRNVGSKVKARRGNQTFYETSLLGSSRVYGGEKNYNLSAFEDTGPPEFSQDQSDKILQL